MAIYYIGSMPESEYLQHFGIQGMKWGQRRFQNPDGTLTSEGKARYKTASRMERKTLDNLKAMKKDKTRLNRMSYRQRRRLDEDIDFYTKRTKGEVKKKNIISRYFDYDRSYSLKNRVKRSAIAAGATTVYSAGMNIALTKAMTGEYAVSRNVGMAFIQSFSGHAENLLISEIYNKAVGRY